MVGFLLGVLVGVLVTSVVVFATVVWALALEDRQMQQERERWYAS